VDEGPTPSNPPRETQADASDYAPTALPSRGARAVAFIAILVAGLCGGLIGYAFVDLQCTGDCTAAAGAVGVLTAAGAAGGVAVVSVLALRAMAEWRTIQHRDEPLP
jgi:hypothetical protein